MNPYTYLDDAGRKAMYTRRVKIIPFKSTWEAPATTPLTYKNSKEQTMEIMMGLIFI